MYGKKETFDTKFILHNVTRKQGKIGGYRQDMSLPGLPLKKVLVSRVLCLSCTLIEKSLKFHNKKQKKPAFVFFCTKITYFKYI